MPERADGEPLVEGRPGDEPPGAVPRVDQALVAEHLERPSHGRTGHAVPVAELRLGVERADVAELPERDALAEVVRRWWRTANLSLTCKVPDVCVEGATQALGWRSDEPVGDPAPERHAR